MSNKKQIEDLKIPLDVILLATKDFHKDYRIGEGGFGEVYKAELLLSKRLTTVALKRLNRKGGQGDTEFWKEVMTLSLYKHENIVSLLGFCDEKDEKILAYEYASNGSLDSHLNSNDLTWPQRLKICIGAACGLAYLHSDIGTHERLLHRDVKSSNILLDKNWNAKITDFGLSKFGPANPQYSHLYSNPVGTLGYCDPLYGQTMLLTKESDVYSFGVVLFEVLCGRLCVRSIPEREPLPKLVLESYKQKKLDEIIYGNIKHEISRNSLKAFTSIAYPCLSIDRDERPLMDMIVRTLNTALSYQTSCAPKVNIYGDARNRKGKEPLQGTHHGVPITLRSEQGVTSLVTVPRNIIPQTTVKKIAKNGSYDDYWDKIEEEKMNSQLNDIQIDLDRNNKNQRQKKVGNNQQVEKRGKIKQSYGSGFPGYGGGGQTQQQSTKQPQQSKGSQDQKLHYYVDYNGYPAYGDGGSGIRKNPAASPSLSSGFTTPVKIHQLLCLPLPPFTPSISPSTPSISPAAKTKTTSFVEESGLSFVVRRLPLPPFTPPRLPAANTATSVAAGEFAGHSVKSKKSVKFNVAESEESDDDDVYYDGKDLDEHVI